MATTASRLPTRALRWAALAVGWTFVLFGTAAMLLYAVPETQLAHEYLAIATGLIPYGVLAWFAATLLFAAAARRRAKLLALATLCCLVVQVFWARPYWPIPTTTASGTAEPVTVMAINLRCDGVGLEELAGEVGRVRPDVLILLGADPESRAYFRGDGWPREDPQSTFQSLAVDPACGTFVISDHPVTDTTAPDEAQPAVTVTLPSGPLVVVPIDSPTPLDGMDAWEAAHTEISRTADAHLPEATIVVGDFNAVLEHLPMRRLLATGFADAAAQAGAGWRPTFPANRSYPPLVTLDHALVSPDLNATFLETFRAGINAHLGLTLRVVRD